MQMQSKEFSSVHKAQSPRPAPQKLFDGWSDELNVFARAVSSSILMPLSLVHRVPSTARSLFTLDEGQELIPASPSFDRKLGTYTLTEHIGAGTSGSNVFAAWLAASPSELVALKVLGECPTVCALPRFLREADITCRLGPHPNLVCGLESGECDGHRYLAMKLLRGQTVGALLQQRGRLEWREATRVALDVARGLSHLATRSVVHRDIKPENIMVSAYAHAYTSWPVHTHTRLHHGQPMLASSSRLPLPQQPTHRPPPSRSDAKAKAAT